MLEQAVWSLRLVYAVFYMRWQLDFEVVRVLEHFFLVARRHKPLLLIGGEWLQSRRYEMILYLYVLNQWVLRLNLVLF